MFEVDNLAVKLIKMGYRKPRKQAGNVRETEIDLHIETAISNEWLAMFGPNWLESLYDKDESKPDMHGKLTKLRLPEQGEIKMKLTFMNMNATLFHGLKNALTFQDAKTRDFFLEPKEGGSVDLRFKLTCRPTPKQLAELDPLIMGGETPLTLEHAPSQAEIPALDGTR